MIAVTYEPGMSVIYDVVTKCAVVIFRGNVKFTGPFTDKLTAVRAAEDFCRSKGWLG